MVGHNPAVGGTHRVADQHCTLAVMCAYEDLRCAQTRPLHRAGYVSSIRCIRLSKVCGRRLPMLR